MLAIGTAAALAISQPLYAAEGDKAGAEFQVNTYTSNTQEGAAIAMDADGDFVVVWWSDQQDGDSYGIFAQRYNADGSKAGDEFQVNSHTSSSQFLPDVAMDANGNFVVTWQSFLQEGSSPSLGAGVYAQRFAADGSRLGDEFRVNTTTVGNQRDAAIAMDADGDFVVCWQSPDGDGYGIFAQRFNRDGSAAGDEFQVNSYTTSEQEYAAIAMAANGDFIISWSSRGQAVAGEQSIYARLYQADGTAVGDEFLVSADGRYNPAVAMDADGDFVVAWEALVTGQGANSGPDVFAQRYQADGTKVGAELKVNTSTYNTQTQPAVAMAADGRFVVSWASLSQDGDTYGVYAQVYQPDGSPAGGEFQVNTTTVDTQWKPVTAMDVDGDFLVGWESNNQDGAAYGIYAQRFEGVNNFAANAVDLSLVINDEADPVSLGDTLVYSLTGTNNGSGIALDVKLTASLPAGLTYVSDTGAAAGWQCQFAGNVLDCRRATLLPAASSRLEVSASADTVGSLTMTASLTAAQAEANNSNNSDSEATQIVAEATGSGASSAGGSGGSLSWLTGIVFLLLLCRSYAFGRNRICNHPLSNYST